MNKAKMEKPRINSAVQILLLFLIANGIESHAHPTAGPIHIAPRQGDVDEALAAVGEADGAAETIAAAGNLISNIFQGIAVLPGPSISAALQPFFQKPGGTVQPQLLEQQQQLQQNQRLQLQQQQHLQQQQRLNQLVQQNQQLEQQRLQHLEQQRIKQQQLHQQLLEEQQVQQLQLHQQQLEQQLLQQLLQPHEYQLPVSQMTAATSNDPIYKLQGQVVHPSSTSNPSVTSEVEAEDTGNGEDEDEEEEGDNN